MKYVAFLRGINVGGNAKVAMKDLIKLFVGSGYQEVKTYINSGNVVFESSGSDAKHIQREIEKVLIAKYGFEIRVVVLTQIELQETMTGVPKIWESAKNIRCYVAFTRFPITPKEVLPHVKAKEGVDMVDIGSCAVYMTTYMEGLTKSGFTKLIGTPIYKDITIRNYRTCQKVLEMMEA